MDERTHARYMSDIAYFLSKMEAEPNSGYFIPIALAYNKLEKYDETIAMCKSAIERFPANCAAKTFLAEAYVYKGQFDLARDLLFDVTAEDDNNYKALKLLGIICKESGETTDALKYLTGAFIRSPEDEEVRKMIEELGGSLNPAQIYDERMKRQNQSNVDSEEDEELKTYQEIDSRIRSAEIIMADLVSDTTITSKETSSNDLHSDDPNDFMPVITTHPEGDELSSDPNDFLPTITQHEYMEEESELDDDSSDKTSEHVEETAGNQDDLLASLAEEDNNAGDDDLLSALSEDENNTVEDDLLSALAGDDSNTEDDLLSALSEDNASSEDDLLSVLSEEAESIESGELLSELNKDSESGDNEILTEIEDNIETSADNQEDALQVATEEETLQVEKDETADNKEIEETQENTAEEKAEDNQEEKQEDALQVAVEEETTQVENDETADNEEIEETLENTAEENQVDNQEDNQEDALQVATEEETSQVEKDETADNKEIEETLENTAEEKVEENQEDNQEDALQVATEETTQAEKDKTADNEEIEETKLDNIDKETQELYSRKIPSSVMGMTYDDMIDDDFQYGKIVDDSYKEVDAPSIDLGESAPFTQGNIMDEILDAVGMTHEDMANDEEIDLSNKEKQLEKLENLLEKVRNNRDDI